MQFSADVVLSSLLNDLSPYIDTTRRFGWSIDNSPLEVACYRLVESLTKKYCEGDEPSDECANLALKKFLSINERMKDWSVNCEFVWEEELLGEFKNQIERFWYTDVACTSPLVSGYGEIFDHGRCGPGASVMAKGTDVYTKLFGSPLSVTEGLSDVWSVLVERNPQFLEAFSDPAWVHRVSTVGGSSLSFVNKTVQIARSIATEPTINMWMQLGFGYHLEQRLKARFGIDIRGENSQPSVNRRLAVIGSMTDQLATIDLESASDSMSLSMLRSCLPKSFMGFLDKLRSPSTRLPDGSTVELNMVSTMGNGFTFPLMTAILSSAVAATYSYSGLKCINRGPVDARNFAIFGDDIIVDRRIVPRLLRLLNLLGFTVNVGKSYVEGPFRESCGTDAFLGHDVRPVYLKRVKTLQEAFVAINNLVLWSARWCVPLRSTIRYLLACYPACLKYPVPPDEDSSAGLHMPRELLPERRKKPLSNTFGLISYTCFVPVFSGYKVHVDERQIARGRVRKPYLEIGMYLSFLYGSVRGSGKPGHRGYRVSVRQKETRYTTKRRVTPRWGYLPPQTLAGIPYGEAYKLFLRACSLYFM